MRILILPCCCRPSSFSLCIPLLTHFCGVCWRVLWYS